MDYATGSHLLAEPEDGLWKLVYRIKIYRNARNFPNKIYREILGGNYNSGIPSGKRSHSDCWNIPIFNRNIIDSIRVHFPASYVSLPECKLKMGGIPKKRSRFEDLKIIFLEVPAVAKLISINLKALKTAIQLPEKKSKRCFPP